jgi:hypothetical protein
MKRELDDIEFVKVYVDDIKDIFNQFDYEDISDELANYIENRCSRTTKNKLCIRMFFNNELTSEEKDRIVTALRAHYGLEKKYLEVETEKLKKVNICYFIAGLLTILAGILLPLGDYIPEIIDVLGGFMIYESASNLLFTDNELDLKSYRAIKISKAKVEFEKK